MTASGKLELVEYDEQKDTINSSLVFDSEKNVAHGQGRVGQLTIQTGQSNFYNNGRYYVRLYRRQAVPRSSRFMSSMRQYRRWSLRNTAVRQESSFCSQRSGIRN
ncbi:MAG: hypothetical protein ACLR3S_10695 [Clostridium fessum]